jgi:glucose-6-phosphate isomerase
LELLVLQVGATGKALTNVVSVGIGGSFLGPLFVHTALLGSSVIGSLETSMHFELTCPENIADFQIQKQQNVQKAGS